MKEKLVNPNYNVDIEGRNRSGSVWRWIFQLSTVIGIIALTALLLNVSNSAFGYAALEAKVDPATLTVDGTALEDQNKDKLITLLKSKISNDAYNKQEKDQPLANQSRANVYQIVVERIVRYEITQSWSLWESLTRANEIKKEAAEK